MLRIDSEPTGAHVVINGRDRGTTPFEMKVGHWAFSKEPSVFSKHLSEPWILEISKEGYRIETIEMTSGPLIWRSLNGVNSYQYWVLNSPSYMVRLRPATRLAKFVHLESIPADWREWRVNSTNAGALAHTLADQRERALLFRTLATLRTDIPLFEDVDELRWHGPKAGFDRLGAQLDAAVTGTRQHAGRWPSRPYPDRSDN